MKICKIVGYWKRNKSVYLNAFDLSFSVIFELQQQKCSNIIEVAIALYVQMMLEIVLRNPAQSNRTEGNRDYDENAQNTSQYKHARLSSYSEIDRTV